MMNKYMGNGNLRIPKKMLKNLGFMELGKVSLCGNSMAQRLHGYAMAASLLASALSLFCRSIVSGLFVFRKMPFLNAIQLIKEKQLWFVCKRAALSTV